VKPRIWLALAQGVVLECLRRKDLWVVAILGFLIMIAAGTLGFFGVQGLQIFIKDLAVSVLSMLGAIVAILTASRMMPDEIKQKTLYPLLARPISRFDLLLGKLLGAVAVSWIAFLLLAALTGLALLSFHIPFEAIMLQFLLCKMMGLVVVCALSMALSAYMTPQAAATMSFIFVFASSMITRAFAMAAFGASHAMQPVLKFLSAFVPQFTLFDLGGRAANNNWAPVPVWVVVFLAGYMVFYTSGFLGLAWMRFRRQAV
jgi:ABC-type transport system involved in multi-copper enzyme maturation permease subunit